tara:strand:- start:543 stop:1232 length:690 start_codon:yes stop_codon:yes gene_type:complete
MDSKVINIFNNISTKYDLYNDLFSLGLHRIWKRKLLSLIKPKNNEKWLDLCCGTGDLTILIAKSIQPNGIVTGVDYSKNILSLAMQKAKRSELSNIIWKLDDVLTIDLPENSFNGISISYGLRNLNNIEYALKKIYNLLKPNGRIGLLDFNHNKLGSIPSLFQSYYLRRIVVPITSLSGLEYEYSYIEDSIQLFPQRDELIKISKDIGFQNISFKTLMFSQMCAVVLIK